MYENIPNELKNLPNWVGVIPDTKIPFQIDFLPASSVQPDTWNTFNQMVKEVGTDGFCNLGFVFNDDGIIGIDMDVAFSEDGELIPEVDEVIERFKSYTEVSKSGRGFHIFVKGDMQILGKNNLNGYEIYKDSRYFIMTGNTYKYTEIVSNQDAIDWFLDKYFDLKNGHEHFKSKVYNVKWPKPDGRIKLNPEYSQMPVGCRNLSMLSLASQFISWGYPYDRMCSQIMILNQKICEVPLGFKELKTICKSAAKYYR